MKTKSGKANYRWSKTLVEYLVYRADCSGTGCWLWSGGKDRDGYGQAIDSKWHDLYGKSRSHQLAYIAWRGPIPEGMLVCHSCDVPSCINPGHLFLGTWDDNVQDMVRKGRHANGAAFRVSLEEVLKWKGVASSIVVGKRLGLSFSRVCQIWRGEYKHEY